MTWQMTGAGKAEVSSTTDSKPRGLQMAGAETVHEEQQNLSVTPGNPTPLVICPRPQQLAESLFDIQPFQFPTQNSMQALWLTPGSPPPLPHRFSSAHGTGPLFTAPSAQT